MNPNSGDSHEGFPHLDAFLDATDAADSSAPLVPPFRSAGTSPTGGEDGGRNMSWNISDLLGPAVFRPSTSAPVPASEPEEMGLDELGPVEIVESGPTVGAVEDQSWLITEESEDLPFLRLDDEPPAPSAEEASSEAEVVPDWMPWTETEEDATEVADTQGEVSEQPSIGWTDEVLAHGGLPMLDLTDPDVVEDDFPSAAEEAPVRFAPEMEEEEELLLDELVAGPEEPEVGASIDASMFSPADAQPTTDDTQGSDGLALEDAPWFVEPTTDSSAAAEEPVLYSEPGEEEAVAGTYWHADEVEEPAVSEQAWVAEEEYTEPSLVLDEMEEESFPAAFTEPDPAEPVRETVQEYAAPIEAHAEEESDLSSHYVETVAYEGHPTELPTSAVESTGTGADAAIMDVASRLEEIASRLRSGGAAGLVSTGGSDPLELLITGFVLGYSQRSDEAPR